MIGIVLFFVGAVLLVNGMAILGRAEPKGTIPINLFVGGLTFLINVYFAVARPFGEPASYYAAATGLLFSFTYLWNAFNIAKGYDGRGFGWFCLFVAVTAIPAAYLVYPSDARFAAFWVTWGALWFLYFLILALKQTGTGFVRFTGYATVATAIFTCWIPGFLILINRW